MFEVVNLKKTYKNQDGKFISLKNISFRLGDSGIVFLFGKSGEGKSTLLNIMSGLDTYDAGGKVLFNGRDIMKMSQKERDYFRSHEIGIIFEKNNLLDDLTVEENVKLARQIGGKEVTQAQVESALDTVKLKGFAKRKISELSSGEVQRVAIARTLLLNPKVIFLDEPTGSLDRENAVIFWDTIREISKKTLVIAISHRNEIVEQYADRVLTIQAGEIVSDEYKNRKLKLQDKESFEGPVKIRKKVEKTGMLSFKTSLRIGSKALIANKFKFFAMLILIAVTLTTFALSYLLATFNPNLVKTKTMATGGYKYVVFERFDGSRITNDDMKAVYDNNTETQYYYIYSAKEDVKYLNQKDSFKTFGYIEVSQDNGSKFNKLGQKVLYGTYPKSSDGDIKIAISDYLAKSLSKNGVTVTKGNTLTQLPKGFDIATLISTDEETIKINIGGAEYIVAAIYETDYSLYVDSNLDVIKGKEDAFAYNNENVYSLIHIAPSKIDDIILSKKAISNVVLTFSTAARDGVYIQSSNISSLGGLNSSVKKYFPSAYDITTGTYVAKTDLSKNEVLLPVTLFNEMFNVDIDETDFFENKTEEEQRAAFNSAFGVNSLISITTESGEEFYYTVVGLTDGNQVVFANNQPDSDDAITGCIGTVIKAVNFPKLRIATRFTNADDFIAVITNLTKNGFEYLSEYTASINSATDFIAQLRIIFITLTVFCLIFSICCMVTFFTDVIHARKRSIGALRSLGAKSINVFLIFLISCLILMISALVLAGATAILSDLMANVQLMKAFSISVTLFHMNWVAFGLMTATGVFVAVFGSLIPIVIYCKKTPIDIIKR